MIRNTIFTAAALASSIASFDAAVAQSCVANAYLADTVTQGNVITRVCKCISGYKVQGGSCVKRPDVIDPRWLAMPGQAERIRLRLDALAVQKAFFEREMAKLKGIEGGLHQLWQDNVIATRSLLQDAQSQTLDLLDGLFAMADLPPGVGRAAGSSLAVSQAYFYQYAYADSADEQRAREKMIDAIGAFKNLVAANSSVIKGREGEAIRAATDGMLKMFKILDRQQRTGVRWTHADFEDAHGAMVDTIHAASRLGGPLKVAVAQANLTFGVPFALRALQADLTAIETAQRTNRTALRSFEDRLARIAQDEALMREGLRLEPQG